MEHLALWMLLEIKLGKINGKYVFLPTDSNKIEK
jgi:hypothetical protein